MGASAWADYLDARLRLVHGWAAEGMLTGHIVDRLTPEHGEIEDARATPIDPPVPGSSRARLAAWQARVEALESEVHAGRHAGVGTPTPVLRVPVSSEVRGLLPHSDPLRCGCQHWSDPPPAGTHHLQCVYGDGVKP